MLNVIADPNVNLTVDKSIELKIKKRGDGKYNLWRKDFIAFPFAFDIPESEHRASEWSVVAVAKSYKRAEGIQKKAYDLAVIEQAER